MTGDEEETLASLKAGLGKDRCKPCPLEISVK
jgi:hypothetical protein